MQIKAGASDKSINIRFLDTTSGLPAIGITGGTAGIEMWYRRDLATSTLVSSIDISDLTTSHTDGGIIHIGNGYYRYDIPDAAFAVGSDKVLIAGSATGFFIVGQEVELTGYSSSELTTAKINTLLNINGLATSAVLATVLADTAFIDGLGTSANLATVLTAVADINGLATSAVLATVLADTAFINGLVTSTVLTMATIRQQVTDALSNIHLDHLLAVSSIDVNVIDGTMFAQLAASSGDWSDYLKESQSLESLSNRIPAALEGGRMIVDVGAISGDPTAASNLELQYDTTGLSGDTFPATQAAVSNIGAAAGGAINFEVSEDNTGGAIDPSSAAFVGSVQGATTFANTEAEDGVVHDIDDNGADDIDIVYGFSIGAGRTATQVSIAAGVAGNADEIKVKAYDHDGSDWEIIGTVNGTVASTIGSLDLSLLGKHSAGTGAEVGKVYIRFETDSTTPSNLSVDKCLVAAVSTGRTVGYAQGAIWVDSGGTAGVENYVNGTADNPCPWANALTIAASLGIFNFHIANGNTLTLTANSDNYTLFGSNWTLALAGNSIVGASFTGAAVSGIASGTGTTQIFSECLISAVSIIKGTHFLGCGIGGTQTVVEAGDIFYDRCHSAIAGNATWIFDFASIANTNLNIRNYSGGIQLENMNATGTDTASIEGQGQVIEGTCTGGVVSIRGLFTVSGITNITLTDDARLDILRTYPSDVTQISGDSTAADNMELDYDGTGYAKANSTMGLVTLATTVTTVTNQHTLADINAEMVDVIKTDTLAEQGQAAPPTNPTFEEAVMYIYQALTHAVTVTATSKGFTNNAGTVIWKKALSDDATTYTEAEGVTGP